MGKYQKRPYFGALKEAGREEDLTVAGEDQSSRKRVEAEGTKFLAADRQKWKELIHNLCF